MEEHAWVKELPAEVMVCDETGIILEMNAEAKALFAKDGGDALLGLNVLGCHPEPSRSKLDDMLLRPSANAYFSTENGAKRFFFQAPWYQDGQYAGFVEISFGVPQDIPNFIRE
jgi:hypothetical protein